MEHDTFEMAAACTTPNGEGISNEFGAHVVSDRRADDSPVKNSIIVAR
jgi:hypothetical protein